MKKIEVMALVVLSLSLLLYDYYYHLMHAYQSKPLSVVLPLSYAYILV